MATRSELIMALQTEPPASKFIPYSFFSKDADTLTVYFESEPDYSERLNAHITIYRSIESNQLVGCRIKGISEILDDLPNYIHIERDGVSLSALFLPFRGAVENSTGRKVINDLAKTASDRGMMLELV